jgi:hypothetical protein
MSNYSLPNKCCRCLGPVSTHFDVTAAKRLPTHREMFLVRVPVCKECDTFLKRVPLFIWGIAAVIGGAIGGATGSRVEWSMGWMLGGAIIAGAIGAAVAHAVKDAIDPARLTIGHKKGCWDITRVKFKNSSYQYLFKKANRERKDAGAPKEPKAAEPSKERETQPPPEKKGPGPAEAQD